MDRTTNIDESWALTIVPDAARMSARAADVVAEVIRAKPDAVISLPTGATPLQLFDVLAARAARGEIDFWRVEFFCLDDYLGLSASDPNSLTGWLQEAFLDRVNLDPARVHYVPAAASNPAEAANAYDRDLAGHGGLDLAVVGIGPNGHVAFNEPGSSAASRTRVVDLTPETIAQASAYWHDELPVPRRAMTVGLANLLEARRIVLIASGAGKAAALRRAIVEPESVDVPASMLRRAGSRFQIIADEAAAAELALAGLVRGESSASEVSP